MGTEFQGGLGFGQFRKASIFRDKQVFVLSFSESSCLQFNFCMALIDKDQHFHVVQKQGLKTIDL